MKSLGSKWFLIVVSVFALVAAACGSDDSGSSTGTEDEGDPVSGGVLIDLQNLSQGDPDHIDPALAGTIQGAQIPELVFDGLTDYDWSDPENPELVPEVAESWEANEDATVWTFTLRDDAVFSNGDPVLPSDFVTAWNRVVDPDLASEISYHFAPIQGANEVLEGEAEEITGLEADDEARTLTVTLTDPFWDFADVVSHTVFSPVPTSEVEALDDQADWESGVMVGNGPFIMAEPWARGRQIVLERNDDYAGEPAYLDGIEFRISADVESAFADFEAGTGQTGYIPPGRFTDAVETYDNATDTTLGLYHFFLNMEDPVVGGEENLKLRQAISLAIDRDRINDAVYDGTRVNATGITPPGIPGYEEGACGDYCTYDPERAQELFDEWEAEGGSLDGPITVNFNADSGHEPVVAIVRENLREIGIETEPDGRDPDTYFSEMRGGDCQFCRAGWIWDYPVYQSGSTPLLHSNSIDGDNISRFSDPEVDDLLDEAAQTEDLDERNALYREAEVLALEQMILVPFNWYTGQIVYAEEVNGFQQTPLQFVLYDQVWLDQ